MHHGFRCCLDLALDLDLDLDIAIALAFALDLALALARALGLARALALALAGAHGKARNIILIHLFGVINVFFIYSFKNYLSLCEISLYNKFILYR